MKKVTVLGLGMGNPETLTLGAQSALEEAQLLVGAPRLLNALPKGLSAQHATATRAEDVLAALQRDTNWLCACVVLSGDIGLFSGANRLLEQLQNYEVQCLPGISSVQYLAAKLSRPWQNWRFVSAHGVACNAAAELARGGPIFFATGGQNSPTSLCTQLCAGGFGGATVTVGQRLSYSDEQITCGSAQELANHSFDSLSVLLAETAESPPWPFVSAGLPDEAFVRGAVPMTKQEVRAAALAKLRVAPSDILYDIGAGTGSVAVELALLAPKGHVYAIERETDALTLIHQNKDAFLLQNLHIVEGKAPEALQNLPAPDAAFVGGSGGKLADILAALLAKNPKLRLCVACVTLETLAEATRLLNTPAFCHFEACQITVSRAPKTGAYHLMRAQNPVFLLSAEGAGQ